MLQSQQIAADPSFLGANHQLGSHKATYKPSTFRQVLTWSIIAAIGVIWTVVCLLFVFDANNLITLGFVVVGLVFIGIALWNLFRIYQDRMLRVLVYDDGLIYMGRGSAMQVMRWQDIEAVKHNVMTERQESLKTVKHFYIVSRFDGTSLTLDRKFAQLRQLGKTIELETAHQLYPLILSTYRTSHSATFGPLAVAQHGLYYRSSLLRWNEVKSIKIDEDKGYVTIKMQGKLLAWASVPLRAVPNIEVFRMLIEHATGVRP